MSRSDNNEYPSSDDNLPEIPPSERRRLHLNKGSQPGATARLSANQYSKASGHRQPRRVESDGSDHDQHGEDEGSDEQTVRRKDARPANSGRAAMESLTNHEQKRKAHDDAEDNEETPKKKGKKGKSAHSLQTLKVPSGKSKNNVKGDEQPPLEEPLVIAAKHFGRSVDSWTSFTDILKVGLRNAVKGDCPEEDRQVLHLYERLTYELPNLERSITEGRDNVMVTQLGTQLDSARKAAKQQDTNALKTRIKDYIPTCNPPIQESEKAGRGFSNDTTGRLLCPISMDWDSPEDRNRLRNGTLKPDPQDWPLFVYANYAADPENLYDGLLRSDVLIKAYRHIFTGPSSAQAGMAAPRATKSGNAAKNSMRRVTPASIAYVAMLVRFSLSSEEQFPNPPFKKSFDLQTFYKSVLDHFQDEELKEDSEKTLAFWDRAIFSSSEGESDQPRVKTMKERLLEQKRGRAVPSV